MGKTSNLIVGFVGGALAGAVTGLLFAPEKGEQTRNRLTYKLNKTKKQLREMLDEIRHRESFFDDDNAAKQHSEQVKRQVEEKAQKIMSDIDDLMLQIEDEDMYEDED